MLRNRLPPLHALTLAGTLLGLLAVPPTGTAQVDPAAVSPLPPPTEIGTNAGEEEGNSARRREWIESMHRAAPGTDWKVVERANRQALALELQARAATGGTGTPSGVWQDLGPADLTGRTHVTVYNPTRDEYYVGTANGMFVGQPYSGSWTPRGDNLGLSCDGLVLVSGTSTHLVAIGDYGNVHHSADAGVTWAVPTGLPDAAVWYGLRVLTDPTRPHHVYLLLDGWRYSPFEHKHYLLRSTDDGATFSIVQILDIDSRPDIWMSRTGSSGTLYLQQAGVLRRSLDAGTTFTTVGSLPVASLLTVLAGCEAGAPELYCASHDGAAWSLYHSANAGVSWAFRSALPGFWDKTLTASSVTSGLVFYGSINANRSTDSGLTWAPVNEWYEYYGDEFNKLHADLPGIDAIEMPGGGERWIFNTDGGTYFSDDLGVTVTNATQFGFHNAKFYTLLTSVHDPYLIAGGSQDQGYSLSRPDLVTPPAPLPHTQQISGDYAHLTSTSGDHNFVYSVYPGFILLQESEGHTGVPLQFIDFPPAGAGISFLPFILAHPHDRNVLYFCADHIWRMERNAPSFTYTNTELPQDFSDGVGAYVTALAISPVDENDWYVATSNGGLWYSTDAGASWSQSSSPGPASHYFYGSALVVSPTDENVAWVGGSGYSNPAVYKTTDGGVTWDPMGAGLPPTHVYDLALDNPITQTLYAGTENAPYAFDAGTGTWSSIVGGGAPLVTYWDVESVPAIGRMRFGTYGRGVWDYDHGLVSGVGARPTNPGAETGLALRMAPNPARGLTRLSFELPRAAHLRVELFDLSGRLVRTVFDAERDAGPGSVELDTDAADGGRPLRTGVYFVRAVAAGRVSVEKLHVVRGTAATR